MTHRRNPNQKKTSSIMGGERRSKRRKSLDVSSPDLISDLPRGVIDGIMERLPLCDAARMCILSHKWRGIWRSTPQLVLDAQFFATVFRKQSVLEEKIYLTHKFYSTVSKILLQHDGPILKFCLYVPPLLYCPDVIEWVSFLSRSDIKDFSLHNDNEEIFVNLSSHLFSCVRLEKLSLQGCIFRIPPNFTGFRKLVSLELLNIRISEDALEHLISSCPLLENLSLVNCFYIERVNINALNLRHFVVVGTFKALNVINAVNLTSASITSENILHKTGVTDLIDVFANSTKLGKLCVGGHFYKVFKNSLLPKTFESVRSLELSLIYLDHLDGLSSAIKAVQTCPNIENLEISVIRSYNLNAQMLDYNPDITIRHLRCAKVGITEASAVELKLIEFLLSCSPVLEILSVAFVRYIDQSTQWKMLKQLSRFRRASPKVEVICPDPTDTICVDSSDSSSSDSDSSSSGSDTYGESSSDSDTSSSSGSD